MERLLQFFEIIILAVINKMNILFFLLLMVLLGFMNKDEVFEWIQAIAEINILP